MHLNLGRVNSVEWTYVVLIDASLQTILISEPTDSVLIGNVMWGVESEAELNNFRFDEDNASLARICCITGVLTTCNSLLRVKTKFALSFDTLRRAMMDWLLFSS